jgi:hypothetical protein
MISTLSVSGTEPRSSIGTTVRPSTSFRFNEFKYFTGVTKLVGKAYYNVKTLREITFPPSIQSIPDNTFDGCSSMTSCILNEGLKTIGQNVWNFTKFVNITIPSSVTSIRGRDFAENNTLRSVIVLAKTPPVTPSYNIMAAGNSSAKIYVPDDSLSAYKAASKWSEIASRIYPISEDAG